MGNSIDNCGAGLPVPVGSAAGYVPYRAELNRDNLLNNDWHTFNGYIQDSYSRGKLRLNGGVRYDWQTSKYLGGCVTANALRAGSAARRSASRRPTSIRRPARSCRRSACSGPRLGATYDLMGDGKTSIHASFGYYYQTKITLANALGSLANQYRLTWGSNHEQRRLQLYARARRAGPTRTTMAWCRSTSSSGRRRRATPNAASTTGSARRRATRSTEREARPDA